MATLVFVANHPHRRLIYDKNQSCHQIWDENLFQIMKENWKKNWGNVTEIGQAVLMVGWGQFFLNAWNDPCTCHQPLVSPLVPSSARNSQLRFCPMYFLWGIFPTNTHISSPYYLRSSFWSLRTLTETSFFIWAIDHSNLSRRYIYTKDFKFRIFQLFSHSNADISSPNWLEKFVLV